MKSYSEKISPVGCTAAVLLAFAITMTAPQAVAQNARIESLEQSLRQLEASVQAIRSELNQLKSDSTRDAQKLMKVKERSASVEKRQAVRNGVSIESLGLGGPGGRADRDAWYIGAGFDFNLTNDTWGLLPRTSVMSEVMFEYKEFGSKVRATRFPPREQA